MERRDVAVSLARGRVAIGVVSLLAPAFVGRMMTARDGSGGGMTLFARMVGARDLGLGLGLLIALDRGEPMRRCATRAVPSAPECLRVPLVHDCERLDRRVAHARSGRNRWVWGHSR